PNSSRRIGEVNRNAHILQGNAEGKDSPMMRWQAAQNLGTLRAIEHMALLEELGLSATADESANVRRECILALGHMPIKTPLSETRRALASRLKARLLETLESFGRPRLAEDDGQVRLALVSTLVTLGMPRRDRAKDAPRYGFQDVASMLYDIALYFIGEDAPGDQRINYAIVERGLGGIESLAGLPQAEWLKARRDLELDAYVRWWNEGISQMPALVDYEKATLNEAQG
ncbi:MAG: hypothetical protein KDB07_12330, partial [Planctomycetes bacterium]|nr:hypothetical protein [Planctomycetota bacterium]